MRNATRTGYGTVARLFHWVTVLLVAVMIPVGIAMTSEPLEAYADPLFVLHKGLGVVVLLVVALRLLWRLVRGAPPLPEHMPALERRVAGLTHWAIYGFLLLQAVTGYVRTVGDAFPIELLDALGVPPLLPEMPEVAGVALVIHRYSPYVLTALIAAHVTGTLRHALIERDGVIERMWPPFGRARPPEDGPRTAAERPEGAGAEASRRPVGPGAGGGK